MKTLDEALKIIKGSKHFSFENSTILVITGYHTGKTLKLDLSNMDRDILEALQVEDEYEDEENWD